MIILIGFSLVVTSRQYIGDPIDCIVEGVPGNVMDTYCWIHSTFTIPNRLDTEVRPRPLQVNSKPTVFMTAIKFDCTRWKTLD